MSGVSPTNASTTSSTGIHERDLLRSQILMFQRMADQLPIALWTTDLELHCTSASGKVLHDMRKRSSNFVGRSIQQLWEDMGASFLGLNEHRTALLGGVSVFSLKWRGREFHVQINPFRNADGEIIGCVGLAVDVTERGPSKSEPMLNAIK